MVTSGDKLHKLPVSLVKSEINVVINEFFREHFGITGKQNVSSGDKLLTAHINY